MIVVTHYASVYEILKSDYIYGKAIVLPYFSAVIIIVFNACIKNNYQYDAYYYLILHF